MKNRNDFLNLYREYETILRNKGIDPKDYENEADDTTSNRLRMCRMFRNYLSHQNDVGFIDVTDEMVSFMEDMIVYLSGDTVKGIMKSAQKMTILETDTCISAIEKAKAMGYPKLILVQTKDGFRMVSLMKLVEVTQVSKKEKVCDTKLSKAVVTYARPEYHISGMPQDRIIVCTDTGDKNGVIKGIIYPASMKMKV